MRFVVAIVLVAIGFSAMVCLAMLSHRAIYGRWRGARPERHGRGSRVVVVTVVLWLVALAAIRYVWGTNYLAGSIFGGIPLALSILLGAVERFGEPL